MSCPFLQALNMALQLRSGFWPDISFYEERL
ncbi:hypothetical protein IMCC3135_02220 [Granulosicoccus antarcticus IMCC3135]|uniref:Uncharacterized protein n=1 Tax=Granulosicoccus antarcticus IMCC3135 TaxID=1192854 RepID=A0A2Z2NL90_9GAMM|nr:hypothetical protein IMCC3135_02220 [Granulosicoccus antarcticus IMCC3135]